MKGIILLSLIAIAAAKLEPTPIVHEGVYKLENQEDGAFLNSAGPVVKGGEDTGAPGQKWIFSETGAKDVYVITPTTQDQNDVSTKQWQAILVGHGKRLLRNTQTQLCLQNSGRGRPVVERECGRSNPKQRWFVHQTSA